jgi:hypothetical protein
MDVSKACGDKECGVEVRAAQPVQAGVAVEVKNPHHDYLARYWQLGFDGQPMVACSGDKPLAAYQKGKEARASLAPVAAQPHPSQAFLHEPPHYEVRFGRGHAMPYGDIKREPVKPAPLSMPPVSAQQGAAEQYNAVECDSALRAEPASQRDAIVGAIARGWCSPANSRKVMDDELVYAIADEVEAALATRCRAEGGDTSDKESSDLAAKAPAAQAVDARPSLSDHAEFQRLLASYAVGEAGQWELIACINEWAASPASTPEAAPELRLVGLKDLWVHDDMDRDGANAIATMPRKDLKTAYIDTVENLIAWRRRALTAEAAHALQPAAPGDFVRDDLDALVREYGNAPVIGPGRTRRVVMQDIYRLASEIFAAPTAGAATTSEDAPSVKQEKLRALADRIDHESLWKRPMMCRDQMTDEQRDRLDAGVMLRRYSDLLAPGRWLVVPPTGSVQFSAASLDKVTEMAKADQDRKAMRATQQEGGNAE